MRISDWSSDVCSSDLDFAPEHAGDIRTLAHEGYWDGMSINRSQDNFVVQWGDPAEEGQPRKSLGSAKTQLPAEFERPAAGLDFHALPDKDGWAPQVGFVDGFPAARDPAERSEEHTSELQSLMRTPDAV